MRAPRRILAAVAGPACVAVTAGCGGAAAPAAAPTAAPAPPVAAVAPTARPVHHARPATRPATAPTAPTAQGTARIDRLARQARFRYGQEAYGSRVHMLLREVMRDPAISRDLQSGNLSALRTYVRSRFSTVWYHQHISRLRIMRGSRVLVDVGVPFVVRPSVRTLRPAHGRAPVTVEVSIQDVIGYVRLLHRNLGFDVVVRGQGTAHIRSSLPAAANARLPRSGTVTLGGRRYAVRSFHEVGLNREPLTVWILARS